MFIGFKMLGEHWINQWMDKTIQVFISLGVIMVCISGSIFYSIFMAKKGVPPDITDEDEKQDSLLIDNFLKYSLTHIAGIVGSSSVVADNAIEYLLLDSRKIYSPATSLFFALKGPRRDGHQFIAELYKKGVRNFVVSEEQDATMLS